MVTMLQPIPLCCFKETAPQFLHLVSKYYFFCCLTFKFLLCCRKETEMDGSKLSTGWP